ncbi:MAG: hypothetical protein ACREQH_02675 [Candidatus Binatus sp.]
MAKVAGLVAGVVVLGVASMPQNARAVDLCGVTPPTQQTALARPVPLGISGGNIHSIIRTKKEKGCFSGTLGSMVKDASDNLYILSNNHVLADQNKAKPGQLIVQPGLVDVQCVKSSSNAVATFSRSVRLKFMGGINKVDAAIAAVEAGQVSPEILFIGETAGSVLSDPTFGTPVQKMGRTTCVTTGQIAGLNANVKVNYSDKKKPKIAKFVDQILISGSSKTPIFSAPGDSGSLILTQGACPQPVALLFAAFSNGFTIANPISTVLTALNVSMVGSCTPVLRADTASPDILAGDMGLSKEAVASATSVRDRHEDDLMSVPGAVGTGIGAGDQPGQTAIEIYVKTLTPEAEAAAPEEVEGVPVKLIESGEAVAY